jgi:hypothetical protein
MKALLLLAAMNASAQTVGGIHWVSPVAAIGGVVCGFCFAMQGIGCWIGARERRQTEPLPVTSGDALVASRGFISPTEDYSSHIK